MHLFDHEAHAVDDDESLEDAEHRLRCGLRAGLVLAGLFWLWTIAAGVAGALLYASFRG